MAIMSSKEFHKRKSIGHKEHKNPIARDIYNLLVAYESNVTLNRKVKLLVLIYFLCLEYNWAKNQSKLQKSKNKKGFDPTQNAGNKIVQLADQIEQEVTSQSFQQQYDNMVKGEHYKGGVLQRAAGQNNPGQAKGLGGHYKAEKIVPQANIVNKYNLNTRVPAFGMSYLSQVFEQDYQLQGNGMQQSEQLAHQKIANLTLTDLFKELHKIWHDNISIKQGYTFTFFNSAQRQQYLATCTNGVWALNGRNPYTTGVNFGAVVNKMYAMDLDERLYIAEGLVVGAGTFNHSSLLSGAPVICAGTIGIDAQGRLVHIDNDSGHYKPTTLDLKHACQVLRDTYGVSKGWGPKIAVFDKATGLTKPIAQMVI